MAAKFRSEIAVFWQQARGAEVPRVRPGLYPWLNKPLAGGPQNRNCSGVVYSPPPPRRRIRPQACRFCGAGSSPTAPWANARIVGGSERSPSAMSAGEAGAMNFPPVSGAGPQVIGADYALVRGSLSLPQPAFDPLNRARLRRRAGLAGETWPGVLRHHLAR